MNIAALIILKCNKALTTVTAAFSLIAVVGSAWCHHHNTDWRHILSKRCRDNPGICSETRDSWSYKVHGRLWWAAAGHKMGFPSAYLPYFDLT